MARIIPLGPAYDNNDNDEGEGEGEGEKGPSRIVKTVMIQGQEVSVDEEGAHVFMPGMMLTVPQWVLGGEEGQGKAVGGEMDEEEEAAAKTTHDIGC